MNSGLWVLSATTPSQTSVLASFCVPLFSNGGGGGGGGMLSASQKYNHGQVDIITYTSAPTMMASAQYTPMPGWSLYGTVSASGLGWLGWNAMPSDWSLPHKQQQQQSSSLPSSSSQATNHGNNSNSFVSMEPNITASKRSIQKLQIGSSVQLHSSPCTIPNLSNIAIQHVRGYASMDVAGCTLAMEATVPSQRTVLAWEGPQIAYHISCDLSNTSSRGNGNSTEEQQKQGPPLIVSMQHSPTRSCMNLSQVLTFDRYGLNMFETRCPNVRNTLSWTVQMTKESSSDVAQLTAGFAWQWNRAVCVKMVVNPVDNNSGGDGGGGITAAVLLKRWEQPRVLCSLLARITSPGAKPSFGLGLELETGPSSSSQQDYYSNMEERHSHVQEEVPATRVTVPNVD